MNFYKEGYYFVPWRQIPKREYDEDQAIEADIPEGIYCELLALMGDDPDSGQSYASLRLVRWPRTSDEPPGMQAVSQELAKLLDAGRRYTPALAIARDAVGWGSGSENLSEVETHEQYTRSLREELDNQRDRPFFLAKSLTWHYTGQIAPGEYTWILRYDPNEEKPIWYVSGDYWAYQCPVTDFDVDIAWLSERFGVSQDRN